MATSNSINANTAGYQAYDGAGTWSGRTFTSSNGTIALTNANGTGGNTDMAVAGGGLSWTDVTGTSQAMLSNHGYIADNSGLVTLTLPTAAAGIGDTITIMGKGAGGWLIAQNSGQQIHVGSSATTAGATGSLASTNQWDNIELICVTAGASSIWAAKAPQGNITIV